jgi:Histidine phosphatase superfamily (branch 1)
MERMWQERADYGHFFYRIPNGESAADAYDRISGFNESLWRQFGDADFPSVCVLVTHGLMTRVFLMKWYHWSVEYFEDLRNINHCEFIVMEKDDNGKYSLQNQLRTWTDFQARTAAATGVTKVDTQTSFGLRRWGGCAMGCNHHNLPFPRRTKRQNSMDITPQLPSPAIEPDEQDDHPIASQDADHANGSTLGKKSFSSRKLPGLTAPRRLDPSITDDGVSPTDADGLGAHGGSSADDEGGNEPLVPPSSSHRSTPHTHRSLRGGGAIGSGEPSDESDFFDTNVHQLQSRVTFRTEASLNALTQIDEADERRSDRRRSSPASPRYRKGSSGKASWAKGGKKASAVGAVTGEEEQEQESTQRGKMQGELGDDEGDGGEPREGSAAADIY